MDTNKSRKKIQQTWMDKEGRNLNLWRSNFGSLSFIHYPSGKTLGNSEVDYYLKQRGFNFDSTKEKDALIPDGQSKKLEIIQDFGFDKLVRTSSYWSAGLNRHEHYEFLVLEGPQRIEPKKGDWSPIDSLLKEAFPIDRDCVEAWFHFGVRKYYDLKQFCPGQLIIMMGEGHDFIQQNLFNASFRSSFNPFHYYLERGARPEELSLNYSWAVDSNTTDNMGKAQKSRFVELYSWCRSNYLDDSIPLYFRCSVSMDLRNQSKRLLSNYLFDSCPGLLVVRCELSKKEQPSPETIAAALPAYLWYLLHEYKVSEHSFDDGYFSSSLRDLCFQSSPENEILSWLMRIYSPEKGKSDMYVEQALMPTHWEAFGISKGMIGSILREKNLSDMLENLSKRYPKNFWLRPFTGEDLTAPTKLWRLSKLNDLVTP